MPLSEYEQRVIEALEQALYEHDPDFDHRLRSANTVLDAAGRRLALSVLGVVVGLVLMLAFCWTTTVGLGIVGFLVMFVSLDIFWESASRMRRSRSDGFSPSGWIMGLAEDTRYRLSDWFRLR